MKKGTTLLETVAHANSPNSMEPYNTDSWLEPAYLRPWFRLTFRLVFFVFRLAENLWCETLHGLVA